MSTMELSPFKLATQSFTLGNLGGAETFCDGARLRAGKVKLSCTNGAKAVINHNLIEYGLINRQVGNNELCANSVIDNLNEARDDKLERCTDSLDQEWLRSYIKKQCQGKN